jgi:O-antigen ligase
MPTNALPIAGRLNVAGKGTGLAPNGVDRVIWLLVALSPFLFAMASWNPEGAARFQMYALRYSLPITIIELIVIARAMTASFSLKRLLEAVPRWAMLVLALLVVIAIVTAELAVKQPRSLLRTGQLLIHLTFGFSVWHLLSTRWAPLARQIWPWVVVGTCLYVLAVVFWVLAVQDRPDFNWTRFSLGVMHIRQTGFYSAVGAAAAIGLASAARTRTAYWSSVAAASVLLGLSYWSGTRSSLVAVLVAFLVGIVLLPALRNWRAVGALVSSAVAGALISLPFAPPHPWYGLLRISETAAAAGADELTTGRMRMWQATLDAVMQRPLFGYGESQFSVAVPDWRQFNHPHNIFLQIAVQWGLVGLIAFLSLGALLAWHFLGAARKGGADMTAPFLVAVSLFTMSLYEGSFYHPYPVMMVALSVAFVLARSSSANRQTGIG